MAKITKTTFKKFLRENEGNIFTKQDSRFDGMQDGVSNTGDVFKLATRTNNCEENTLGYADLWLVGESRDRFELWENDEYTGFHWYNCCGSGYVVIKK